MTALENWIREATRGLCADAASQIRTEIGQHYECSRETALKDGASAAEADRLAVSALGDPKNANCQYRKVMLTKAEARVLREGNWEARAICGRVYRKGLLLALPLAALIAAAVFLLKGNADAARIPLIAGLGMGFLFGMPLLPIFTPSRSRIVRYFKWVVLAAMPLLAFGNESLKYSWLLVACIWPVFWVEVQRNSLRKKLPAAQWPKHLYL